VIPHQDSLAGVNPEPKVSVVIPVTLAMLSTLCFTISSTFGRYIINKAKGTLTSSQLIADGYVLQSIIMLVLMFLQSFHH
jgi:drug/metabolite transporter (DMT)-like permease